MTALLVLALAAPAGVVVATRLAPAARTARQWASVASVAIAACWVLPLLVDANTEVGRFGVGAAPVAAGTWLLASAVTWPSRRLSAALAVVTAATASAGVALGAGRGDLSDTAGALALASVGALIGGRLEDDGGSKASLVTIIGAAAVAVGLVGLERDTGGFGAGGGLLVVAGGGIAALAATTRARRVASVLLPIALVLSLQAAIELDRADWLAVAAAVAGAACAWRGRGAASLVLWSVAAAAVDAGAASLLLGAAAVVAVVLLHPLAGLAALPGAASLALTLVDDGSPARLVVAAAGALTAAGLWRPSVADTIGGRPSPATAAGVVTGAWLVLAPETWGWVGRSHLASWGTGVLVALVGGLIGTYVAASVVDAHVVAPDLEVADPVYALGDPPWARRAALAALVLLAAAEAALVAAVLD